MPSNIENEYDKFTAQKISLPSNLVSILTFINYYTLENNLCYKNINLKSKWEKWIYKRKYKRTWLKIYKDKQRRVRNKKLG